MFGDVTFRDEAHFGGGIFEEARYFGPVLAHKALILDGVQFAQPVQIVATALDLWCRWARFPSGVQFELRWARVALDNTDLSAPSLLTGNPSHASEKLAEAEERIAGAWKQLLTDQVSEQPRLLSLRRSNVAGLGLGNVNLAGCRFAGAHNIDKLRLEANVAFALSPARLGWDRRQVIAEESDWRVEQTHSGRWIASPWPQRADSEKPELHRFSPFCDRMIIIFIQ